MPTVYSDERQLVQRAQRGDAEAVTVLYRRHGPEIYRYFLFRVGDERLTEDLTGEVFLHMVQALPRYEERGVPFAAWLYRIARARLIDHQRRLAHRRSEPLSDTLPDHAPGPEHVAAERTETRRLMAALAALTDEQRMTVQLRFIEGHSLEITARLMGKGVGAVKALQHRALRHLAKELKA